MAPLWSFATKKGKVFYFKTIDEVLEENFRFKREIKDLKNQLNTNITFLMEELEKNKMEINNTKMPVGSIISWVNKVNKVNKAGSVELPKGWMRCDGSLISEVGSSQ